MQTLTRDPQPDLEPERRSPRRRTGAILVGLLAVVVISAGIAYAIGTSQSKTTTVVRTVAPPARSTNPSGAATPACVKGVAPGSCNTDEASQINLKDQPLHAPTRALLAAQLVEARAAALRYPTVADALRAGFLQAGQFSPLTGAHFINVREVNNFDPANPGSLIYDGTSPTSKVIGTMFLSSGQNPPQGFAGPNDHWHRHANTCVVFNGGKIVVPFAADSDVTISMCNAEHGTFMRRTVWMVHAWVVPGWESPNGVFAHDNTNVLCADGTTHTNAVGFCKGT
jgi:hypothetical protein